MKINVRIEIMLCNLGGYESASKYYLNRYSWADSSLARSIRDVWLGNWFWFAVAWTSVGPVAAAAAVAAAVAVAVAARRLTTEREIAEAAYAARPSQL